MISREQMFEPILEVSPSFRQEWQQFLQEYNSEENDIPYYLALSALARHLVVLLETGKTEELKSIFKIVEQWHLNGDVYVKEAATVGLLEDLQNSHLHRTTSPEEFISYFLSETLFWWNKINDFWKGKNLIHDDRKMP